MFTHGGFKNLARDIHELVIDLAHDRNWPFDQTADFFQKTIVFQKFKALGSGKFLRTLKDDLLALFTVKHDLGRAELFLVFGRVRYAEFSRGKETMAAGGIACGDRTIGDRNDLAIKQAKNAVKLAHPTDFLICPAHGFRPRQFVHRIFDDVLDDFGRSTAFLFDNGKQEDALGRFALFTLIKGHTIARKEAINGLFRCIGTRATAFFAQVRLLFRQTIDNQGQATRGYQCFDLIEPKVGGLQTIGDQFGQVFGCTRLHAGRDFFGEQFKK